MNTLPGLALEVELYQKQFQPSIAELEERKLKLVNDVERAKYVNSLLAIYKLAEIQKRFDQIVALVKNGEVDEWNTFLINLYQFLGLIQARHLISWISLVFAKLRTPKERQEKFRAAVLSKEEYQEDNDVLRLDEQTLAYLHDKLGIPGTLEHKKKIMAVNRLKCEKDEDKEALFRLFDLCDIRHALGVIEEYLHNLLMKEEEKVVKPSPQIQELIHIKGADKWFTYFLYESPISKEEMDEYFKIGQRMGCARRTLRTLYCIVTLWGMITESMFIGLAKLQFVFGLIYANVTSEFLATHVQVFSENLSDDVVQIQVGLKKWAIACSMVAFLAFIVYETLRIYSHIPRFCRRGRLFNFYVNKQARRFRRRFTQIMNYDTVYDDESPTYQFEYDSENDDPDVAAYYYHLREKECERKKAQVEADYRTQLDNGEYDYFCSFAKAPSSRTCQTRCCCCRGTKVKYDDDEEDELQLHNDEEFSSQGLINRKKRKY
jgi:hypothetical protein